MTSIRSERSRSERSAGHDVKLPLVIRHRPNPFATRFTGPGALDYQFDAARIDDLQAVVSGECPHAIEGPGDDPENDAGGDHAVMLRLVGLLVLRRVGSIVGPHGSGKTTLLRSLVPLLEKEFAVVHLLRLGGCESTALRPRWQHARQVDRDIARETQRIASAAGQHGLLVIDGAEQISSWQRRRLLRASRRHGFAILATSHQPLSGMDVLFRTRLDAKLIWELTMQLLGDVPQEVAAIVLATLGHRDLDRISNLREFWFELYDVVQPQLIRAEISDPSNQRNGRPTFRASDSIETSHSLRPADD